MAKKYVYPFLCATYLLFLQIFLLSSVKSEIVTPWENIATNATSRHSGRVKRSPIDEMTLLLHVKIKYEDGEEVMMRWMKTNSYVANEFLPVYVSLNDEKIDVRRNVGKFISYYDIQHCSAVVYFRKSNSLYGVIGTDYYIENLPFNFDRRGQYRSPVVGYPYIKKRQSQLNHIHPNYFVPEIYSTSSTDGYRDLLETLYENDNNQFDGNVTINLLDAQYNTNTEESEFQNYFLETVVFVTRDIADNFLGYFGPDDYVGWIVKYYLVYFHAIDMMFKTLVPLGRNIHMNIAKICIETHTKPYSFLSHNKVQYNDIIRELPIYFSTFREDYPEDSFDYVFIHTSRPIWDGAVRRFGVTKLSGDLTRARSNNQFYNAVPITIMGYEYPYADYVTTVHAIGGIFNMNVDSEDQGLTAAGQCYSVMQRGGPRCSNCLRWSETSKKQLGVFLRTNKNRCFFLNYPRALIRFGRGRLYSPMKQCECYGYNYYKKYASGRHVRVISAKRCAEFLECEQPRLRPTPSKTIGMHPFDGTPCGNGKVCWNKECVYP